MSQRDIASLAGRPLSSINRIVQAFGDDQRLENLSRGSRSKATTDDEDRMIVAAAVDDPTSTAKEIQAELNLQVSVKTIRNRLHEAGLRSRVPARKPLLSAVNRQKRLQFAYEHASWSLADCENVLFSDESTFTTRWDQRQRIWRADNTRGSKDELWAAVEAEWVRLRASDLFARLFESLPRRLAAVVAAGGLPLQRGSLDRRLISQSQERPKLPLVLEEV
ncbi:hypothetical protein HPB47_018409 [Ixodes persulcatus]|uniref:Uncharacterized protein n=1 Tax=Ixodes persulcatus TaxID=34615 RepID=A0AC60QLU1_IXOPE|nr:hypothetical protein HPB47_018409 [Ixodes persulcatus]